MKLPIESRLKKNCRAVCFYLLPVLLVLMTSACDDQLVVSESAMDSARSQKELLIYCGITMIQPMSEIATIIEKQENCKVTITKGGSGNLLKSILHNQTGDLYLPGSDRYFSIIANEHAGLVSETVLVGANRAAMMVQKGNPKAIPANLTSLADSQYAVVIGNPDSGSIGKETKKILEKKGIFADVVKNAMYMTTDSKELLKAIKNKEADIVINWFAASTWDDNGQFLDVIDIDPEYAQTKKLMLGLLKFSQNPDLAGKLMNLAGSKQGSEIFRKYGLRFD
ncbi:MAG: substrate-binding domain-containing protein [Thermodesulfobacteriota bacterium]|nr:substrate-binding domain-containing protein [Thermodesulfobacteriota bacterium]